jgi:hypothetical protein
MKKLMLFAALLMAFATAAQARIITYTWHQTSTTWPGLVFTAYYQVIQGVPPLPASSVGTLPDFGGLVDFYIQGGSYPAITLASLVEPCLDTNGCTSGGADHDFGYPFWQISIPNLLYVNAADLSVSPFHIEWEYWASPTTILIGDDNAGNRCWDTSLCTATGYWKPDFDPAPEPMTLFAFLGGLALLGTGLSRRKQQP